MNVVTNKRILSVYLAGPITGWSYNDVVGWREVMQDKMGEDFNFLSPMRTKDYLEDEATIESSYETSSDPLKRALSSAKGINARDFWDCKKCDVLFMNLLGTTFASIGTSMEIAWGHAYQKPVIVCMEKDNIHQHAMIQQCATHILEDFDVACEVLHALR